MVRPLFALVPLALLVVGSASSTPQTKCPNGTGFAELAYIDSGRLLVLDMPGCNGRVLVRRGARPPVRWSADGRYIAFGGGVVSGDGNRVFRGLGGVWAPHGRQLATIVEGGVNLGEPGRAPRRVLPDGSSAYSLAFDPTGRLLAVGRVRFRGAATPSAREIWVLDLRTGTRRLVYRVPKGNRRTPILAGWAPGSFVLFTLPLLPAISINLDGLPLYAVAAGGGRARRVVGPTLTYEEFVSVCGAQVAIAAGYDRQTTRAKRLVVAAPPLWRPRDLSRDRARSWIAPACSPDRRSIAVSAGRNWIERRFGLERRSIWILSLDGRSKRRLTSPPMGQSDEFPRWNRDGSALFFIRSGPTRANATARGTLYVLRLDGGRPERVADDLGPTANFYGRYGWAEQTDLFVPRIR